MATPSKEIQDNFLKKGRNAIVGTNGVGRGPNLSPYWYLWDEDSGTFLISSSVDVAKVKDLARDPNMTICIDDAVSNLGLYVTVYGKGVVIGPGEAAVEPSLKLIKKYRSSDEATRQHWNEINADNQRVVIEMTPEKWHWRDV